MPRMRQFMRTQSAIHATKLQFMRRSRLPLSRCQPLRLKMLPFDSHFCRVSGTPPPSVTPSVRSVATYIPHSFGGGRRVATLLPRGARIGNRLLGVKKSSTGYYRLFSRNSVFRPLYVKAIAWDSRTRLGGSFSACPRFGSL